METSYTKSQIETILRQNEFEYHRVDLPYGLATPGDDRSATRDMIFPLAMDGCSVLDVGCANGYFCFEAEVRGARRVVGVELMDSRYRHAELLKSIRGSNVEFLNADIRSRPLNDGFDYVLLLNVIHHLPDPIHVLKYLARLTCKTLVVEFPTFSDPKFRNAFKLRLPSLYNRLPLIGVSSLSNRSIDQTFVFSPAALERILMDHDSFFTSVEVNASSWGKGRKIAIFRK